MDFEIFYKGEMEGEFPSPDGEYMIREDAPGGGFVESYFKNGMDMLEYIDKHQMLRNNTDAFPSALYFDR